MPRWLLTWGERQRLLEALGGHVLSLATFFIKYYLNGQVYLFVFYS